MNTPTITEREAKVCTVEDFGNDTKSEEYFSAWAGFDLICPKFEPGEGFFVEGEPISMISSNFVFNINRCTKGNGHVCKSDKEIEDFINDIQIDVWHLQYNMDFTKFNMTTGPIFKSMDLLYSNFLRHDEILFLNMSLMKNLYTLKDTYLQILKWFD